MSITQAQAFYRDDIKDLGYSLAMAFRVGSLAAGTRSYLGVQNDTLPVCSRGQECLANNELHTGRSVLLEIVSFLYRGDTDAASCDTTSGGGGEVFCVRIEYDNTECQSRL